MPSWHELRNLAFTVAVALISGVLLEALGAPAPYLLGSLFGVWFLGGLVQPARSLLVVPRWLHVSVTLGMGVLVGAMFDPAILDKMSRWSVTVAGMLVATLLATAVGFVYLHRLRGYPRLLSLLCCFCFLFVFVGFFLLFSLFFFIFSFLSFVSSFSFCISNLKQKIII